MRRASLDPALSLHVVRRTPLLYASGPDEVEDRPAHVRAASGVARVGDRLAIIQDDALFVAYVEPTSGAVTEVCLPRGPEGLRLFGDDRGNKHHKLDLEACVALTIDSVPTLVAFGSGSSPARERIVLVADGTVRIVDAASFYRRLRETHEFAGSELNVEGVTILGDRLVLASRGNGAARDGLEPVDATLTMSRADFLAYMRDPGSVPAFDEVVQYDLGAVDGSRLTFTDLMTLDGRLFYVACAEASPDALRDGPVSGVAIGELDSLRYGLVRGEGGERFTDKIEGITPAGPGRLHAVVDVDDTQRPAELLEIAIEVTTA